MLLSRPRNSFGPSYRPPHEERRRLRASVIARLGGGAARRGNASRRKNAGVPSTRHAAEPLAQDRRLVALCGARVCLIAASAVPWLELDVWLTHALPLRREELLHREHRASRQHVKHRPPNFVREDRQRLSFPVLLLDPRQQLLPPRCMTQDNTAASEKAHFKWTLPILAPPVPSFLPPDSC